MVFYAQKLIDANKDSHKIVILVNEMDVDVIQRTIANYDRLEKKTNMLQKKCNNYARKQKESLSHINIFKEIRDIYIDETMLTEYDIRDYICEREYGYNLIPLMRM